MSATQPAVSHSLPSLDSCLAVAQSRLRPKRFLHTLGVCQSAVALAIGRGMDPDIAAVAALLHDIAKETPTEELKADLEKRGRPLDPEDLDFPSIWHALAGAAWAEQDFGVSDPDALEAIRLHPTGDAGMSPLAQVLFLADFTDATRSWEGARDLRRLTREDFAAALARAVTAKVGFLKEKGKAIHPRALRALEAYGPPANPKT